METVAPDFTDPAVLFVRFGIALGLGVLTGLQRQRSNPKMAGIRTFPLVTLFGALAAVSAERYGEWILAGSVIALALIILGAIRAQPAEGGEGPGITSEAALLAMFALGAYVMFGSTTVAVAVGAAMVVLLHLKPQMHALAGKIEDQEFRAVLQFVIVGLVILPVLPNRTFGPFDVLNPYRVWMMVVLMVGMSLVAYITYKFFSGRAGAWTSAILGGFVSSTAATVNAARANKDSGGNAPFAAFVILVATGVSFVRLALLIAAINPSFLPSMLLPLGSLFAVLFTAGWWNSRSERDANAKSVAPRNPAALKTPLLFGLLYGVMLVVVAAANSHFGQRGVFVAGAISGLTEMDAITLSITNLVKASTLEAGTGWRVIVVAALSNLVFKGAVVSSMGERSLVIRVWTGFAVAGVFGVALLVFAP